MANYDLGTARGTIEITYNGNGVTQAQQGLSGLSGQATTADQALDKTANTAGVAGIAIAGGLALAVNSAANFEQRLSAIQAVSGNTAQQMELVRAKALQIGKDTSFSATEAAQAMEELSKAGVSTADILSGAADATVALAAAGEVDLPEAATIASNAMNQFSLKAQDLPRVADLIAGAANASAIDVKEFGYSLSQAGAVANLAGLSFDDLAIAVAEMGNAGIKGSDAGTSLKSMLSHLQPTTKAATNEMESLGLITYENETAMKVLAANGIKPLGTSYDEVRKSVIAHMEATYGYAKGSKAAKDAADKFIGTNGIMKNQLYDQNGNLKSLRDIQELVGNSLKGLTAEQKQAALQTIFGSDAIRAAAILSKEGAAGYDKMAAAMGKVKAADVAKTKLDNMKGSLEAMKGSAETLAIQLGTVLIPAIRGLIDFLNTILSAFLAMPEGLQKFIVIGGAFVATLLIVVAAIIKMKLAFDALKITMIALNGTFLANPIFWIVLAIIALVAALVLAYKNSETFRNIVNAVWAAIKSAIGAVVDWLVNTAWPFIQMVWDGIVAGLKILWGWMTTAWNAIKDVVMTVWNFISAAVRMHIAVISAIINAGLTFIKNIWDAIWGTFGPLITAVWDLIVAIIKLAWAVIRLIVETQIMVIKTVVMAVWNFIKDVTTTTWNAIKAVITAVWDFLKPYIVATITAIQTVITTVWNAIKTVITTVINTIKTIITTAWNAIKSVTTTVWNAVDSVIGDKVRAVIAKVKDLVAQVKGFFANAGTMLLNAGKDIIQGLINGVTSKIREFTQKIRELTNLIPQLKGPPEKDKILLEKNGELIMTGLINGINNMTGPLTRTLSGIGSGIPDSFTTSVVNGAGSSAAALNSIVPATAPVYNTNVYNPLPEPAGESVNKRLQTLTMMGA